MSGAELGQSMFERFSCAAISAAILTMSAAFAASPPAQDAKVPSALARIGAISDPISPARIRGTRAHAKSDPSTCFDTLGPRKICGVQANGDVDAYLGIKYGNAQRWQRATIHNLPSGRTDADAYGAPCPQIDRARGVFGAEDCLFLNIWMPKGAGNIFGQKLPVMVFIHGGAFTGGSGGEEGFPSIYDGSALASKNIIVVTLNYRLGALGFLAANDQGVQTAGNFGLTDQQLALLWIQNNILYFGGDANDITVFGESAGAMSVGLHTFDMPRSKDLFKRAIMESNPMGEYYLENTGAETNRPYAQMIGKEYLDYLCGKVKKKARATCSGNWAHTLPMDVVVRAQDDFQQAHHEGSILETNSGYNLEHHLSGLRSLTWEPTVDHDVVIGEPFDGYADLGGNTRMPSKPLLFGMNKDEGVSAGALLGGSRDKPSGFEYGLLLAASFGSNAATVRADSRYESNGTNYDYYSAYGQAFANIVTDFSFVCGNDKAGQNILAQYPTQMIYAYYFKQPPFFDLMNPGHVDPSPDHGACMPAANNTCHTNELPYVFSTFGALHSAYRPRPGDGPLATKMTGDWTAFAKGQLNGWSVYDRASTANTLINNGSTNAPTENLDTVGHCSVWKSFDAYGRPNL
jgi:para-nitrobenzyl esterase